MALFLVTTTEDEAAGTTDLATETADGNGLSLREAVAIANATATADEISIEVAGPNPVLRLTLGEIAIDNPVTIAAGDYFGFAGVKITGDANGDDVVFSSGNTNVRESLDGQDLLSDNSRIFNIGEFANGPVILDGLTLTGGRVTADSTGSTDFTGKGGAVVSLAELRIYDSRITGNSTAGENGNGGGVATYFLPLTMVNSYSSANHTYGERAGGGGVFAFHEAFIIDSSIGGNSTNARLSNGGGITGRDLTIVDSSIAFNDTRGERSDGAGISDNGNLVLYSSVVYGNFAGGDYSRGGGISTQTTSSALIVSSSIFGNTTSGSDNHGGGIHVDELTLINSTVSGNEAGGYGATGGGIATFGSATLVNSTLSGNYAHGYGGGIQARTDAALTIENSIIAGNSGYLGGDDLSGLGRTGNSLTAGSENLFGSAPAGFDIQILGDGLLTIDGSSEAELQTVFADVGVALSTGVLSGLALLNGPDPVSFRTIRLNANQANPALDAGDSNAPAVVSEATLGHDVTGDDDTGDTTATIADFAFDNRGPGFPRNIDLPFLDGAIDLGAFEVQSLGVPPVAGDDQAATDQFVPIFMLDVLANDTDADGDDLTVLDPGATQGGRAFANDVNTFISYAPRLDFVGTDTFEYTVSDGRGGFDTGTVEVTVSPLPEDVLCARTVAYLYEAAFDRFPDLPGLNFWIDFALDGTLTKEEIAEFFLTVPEFVNLYGPVEALTDEELVEQLFLNTLDRPGEQAGVDFWVSVLADPEFSRAEMLLAFAQSPENQLGSPDIVTLEEVTPGEWEFV